MQIKVIPPTEPEFELRLSRAELLAIGVLLGGVSHFDLMKQHDGSPAARRFNGIERIDSEALFNLFNGIDQALRR